MRRVPSIDGAILAVMIAATIDASLLRLLDYRLTNISDKHRGSPEQKAETR